MIVAMYAIKSFHGIAEAESYCANPQKTTIEPPEWDTIFTWPDDIVAQSGRDPNTGEPTLYYITSYKDSYTTLSQAIHDNIDILHRLSGGSIHPRGILCHHVILSFPTDSALTSAEIMLIGAEFVRRIDAPRYSTLYCHIRPTTDGVLGISTGKQKHIHILIPAYRDYTQYTPGSRKVKYCPRLNDLRQIADQLAVDAGLPIICTPDTNRKMGNYELRLDAVDRSRKTELAQTIAVAAACTSCWHEYVAAMQSAGYAVDSNAKRTLYTSTDGHPMRDRSLGRAYCRSALEERWERRQQTRNVALTRELNTSSDIPTILAAASTVYPLSVELSVGPSWDKRAITLPISGHTRATRDVLLTYLDPAQTYPVLHADGSTYLSATGEEIITTILHLQQLYYPDPTQIPLITGSAKTADARKKQANDTARYRAIERHLLEPGVYGPDGRLRSLPMLLIGFVLMLLDREDLLMVLSDTTLYGKTDNVPNEQFFANANMRLQTMYDSYLLSDQLEIRDIVDLDNRLLQLSAIHQAHTTELQNLLAQLPQWEALDTAVTAYMHGHRATAEAANQATIAQYQLAKALLDQNGYAKHQYIALTRKYAAMVARKAELEQMIAQDQIDYVGLRTIARGWVYTLGYADNLTHKHIPSGFIFRDALNNLQTAAPQSSNYRIAVAQIRSALKAAQQHPDRQQTRGPSR